MIYLPDGRREFRKSFVCCHILIVFTCYNAAYNIYILITSSSPNHLHSINHHITPTTTCSRSTGQTYYLNLYTKESQWEKPEAEASNKNDERIRCQHLLVKHSGSRRPFSWRHEAEITRTKEQARDILKGYKEQIESGKATLEELAKEFSDCSSAKKGER